MLLNRRPSNWAGTIRFQLLDALTLLQEGNVIHCDLKPENILLTRYRYVELQFGMWGKYFFIPAVNNRSREI